MDPYYSRQEVSNSMLTELKKYFYPDFINYDPEVAFKFGNLIDAMITEPQKIDYFQKRHIDYEEPFTEELWNKALEMRKAILKDNYCMQLFRISEYQKIFIETVNLTYGNFPFSLKMRCKYDFWMSPCNWGGDIKSTAATSQKQFEEACKFFDYDRSRVVYMMLSGSKRDIIIGISKVNCKIFKIPITIGDEFYKSGLEKLTDIAFRYWMLFENV